MKMNNNYRNIVILSLVIMIGLFFRIYNIGKNDFWVDEVRSVYHSSKPVPELIDSLSHHSVHPPLYFVILHFWMKSFGNSEFTVRMLSALFGILTVLLIYKVGSELFNREVGLLSSLICSISSFHILYSKETRGYTLFALLGLLSFYYLYKLIFSEGKESLRYSFLYILVGVALLLTHYWAVFLFIPEIIYFLFLEKKPRKLLYFLFMLVASILIGTIIFFGLIADKIIPIFSSGFKTWIGRAKLSDLILCFEGFMGTKFDNGENGYSVPLLYSIFIYSVYLAILIVGLSKKMVKGFICVFGDKFKILFNFFNPLYKGELFLLFYSCTLLLPFFISYFLPIFFPFRYPIIIFPSYCIFIGYSIFNIKKKILKNFLIVLTIVSSLLAVTKYYDWNKSNFKEIVRYIERTELKNDFRIYIPTYYEEVFSYYYQGKFKPSNNRSHLLNANRIVCILQNRLLDSLLLSSAWKDSFKRFDQLTTLIDEKKFAEIITVRIYKINDNKGLVEWLDKVMTAK